MFQQLLDWILANCILTFSYGGKSYELSDDYWHNAFILVVNFGFWVILAFFLCFFIKLSKWCVRRCLRK